MPHAARSISEVSVNQRPFASEPKSTTRAAAYSFCKYDAARRAASQARCRRAANATSRSATRRCAVARYCAIASGVIGVALFHARSPPHVKLLIQLDLKAHDLYRKIAVG